MARDRYDQEIERVTEVLEGGDFNAVTDLWAYGDEHSPLFDALTPSRSPNHGERMRCGCPVLVKCGAGAWIPELTKIVRQDQRIPTNVLAIRPSCLEAFAEIQRLADTLLARRPLRLLSEIAAVGGPR